MPRVLYIDDDEGLRLLTSRRLRRLGFTVETAADADSGVARLSEGGFDLVAIDHYMPGKTGLDALAMIGALASPPPVVYVTGSEETSVAVAALKAGATDYVVKTVGDDFFDLLASSFRQSLERRALLAAKEEAEQALRASNERLAAMVKEANHRVANSLQILSAFVNLQASAVGSDEAKSALRDTQQRIAAIAQVHRRLYNSDVVDTIDMAEYLLQLSKELEATWSTPKSPRTVDFTAEPMRLKTDRAVSLGIIVTELVGNACKYAYGEDQAGVVRIRLVKEMSRFHLRVEDDGPGVDLGAKPKGTGVGTRLIRAMAQSLGAELEYGGGPGARICVTAAL
ncbi:histidine kinase dimerization/phosphoacceptor domain -containing protein [Jiella sonneratiae]|uniref:histidine kinase n=1 Tax=Jiella sonneratiae TaxID=2816856 RepID=A0ABS3J9M4_9HYPH|nr:histidine kinase dimerization/phosphoacceptor domain -containing protein [Jiella sonneratiae]MBO0906369.1 response regulator [Jiella sonneratiae]